MGTADVLMIQETWLCEEQAHQHLQGRDYHVFADKGRTDSAGGGTAILVKSLAHLQVHKLTPTPLDQVQGVEHLSVRISDSREPPETGLTVTNIRFYEQGQITPATLTKLANILGGTDRWILGGNFGCHAEAWDASAGRETQGGMLQNWASGQLLSVANVPNTATHEEGGRRSSPDVTLSRGAPVHQWRVLKNDPAASEHSPIVFSVLFGKQGGKVSHRAALKRLAARFGADAAHKALAKHKKARDAEADE
jgi:hypothetical protein